MKEFGDLRSAYQAQLSVYWLRLAKVSALVALVLVPAGIALDYIIYPDEIREFAILRLLCNIVIGVSFIIYYTPIGKWLFKELTFFWLLSIQAMICYMILETEGAISPYYAGLNLSVLAVGIFLPTNTRETIFFSVATLCFYLVSIASFRVSDDGARIVFNNVYFLVLTAIITSFASFFGDRKRFEEFRLNFELDNRNRELAEIDKTKSEFFSNISHELRTPLTLILSPAQDILESKVRLPDKVGSALGTIRNNALRLLKLVNDLLDVMRLEEGKHELEKAPVFVDPLVAGICESFHYLADIQGIELKCSWNANGTRVLGDVSALEKVFVNILNNAVKFCEAGGVVEITSGTKRNSVFVTVKDTGVGISQDDLPFIFDRFRQADGSTTRRFRGTGLGLTLVKEFVDRHSGRVGVSSGLGKGTVVTVELPIYRAATNEKSEVVDHAPLSIGLQRLHKLADFGAGITLDSDVELEHVHEQDGCNERLPSALIVDDEPDMRRYLVSMLVGDYCVFQATNGTDGLALAQEKLPDVMLLDLMLPGLDGLEICRLLKADDSYRRIKIILLTARVDEDAKLTALDNGADDFVTKPFSRVEVRSRLENLRKTAGLERDLEKSNKELNDTLTSLKATQSQLIQSEKLNAIGSLAAGLLHEINNPLNYSLTALQLIRGDAAVRDNELVNEVIGDIDEGMQRIHTIVRDLRAFAYPSEADKCTPFDLREAVESAQRFTAYELNGIAVDTDLPRNSVVVGSKSHITQVFVNLFTNSAKAIVQADGENRGKIRVTGAVRGPRVEVTVSDNGVGMDEKTLERVFDPFFTTRDVGDGMGLGLSICHTIVGNHGGQLLARSKPGEGTELVLDLPLDGDAQV